jgi:hypothetical protein
MARSATLAAILARAAAVALAALALCWAAVLNGQPFFHPDTLGYVRGPDVAIMKLLGPRFASPWALLDPAAAVGRPSHAASGPGAAPGSGDKEVLAGRSIYYGVLADLGARTGGFWLTIAVQALAVAWLVEILLRSLEIGGLRTYAGVMAALTLLTPAPFFAGFLMPDIWVGIAIAALATVFAAAGRLSRLDGWLLALMVLFAALAHSTTPPVIAGMMLAAAGLWLVWRGRFDLVPGLALGGLALVTAVAGALAFNAMVLRTVGAPPVTPPFLTARLVDDGTGALYAQRRCAGQDFAVCRFADRFPMDGDHFLWGESPRNGVFETASPADRRTLGQEQTRFALAVVRAYPLQQAAASARDVAAQEADTDLSDFNYKPSLQASFAATLPPPTVARMDATLAHRQGWALGSIWVLQTAALTLLAAAAVLVGLRAPRARAIGPDDARAAATRLAAMIVVGVLANGAVCGLFSTLFGRYQARVIWLLPLAALAWIITRIRAGRLTATGPA